MQHSFFYASYLVSIDHLESLLIYHPCPTRCFQLFNKVVLLLLNLSHKASRNLSLPYTLSSKSVSSNYNVFIQFMFLEPSISLQFIPVKRFYANIILKQSIQPHTKSPPVSQSLFSLELWGYSLRFQKLSLNSFHKSLVLFQMASPSSKFEFPLIKK